MLVEALRKELAIADKIVSEQAKTVLELGYDKLVFSGAGDSYAAALSAASITPKSMVLDPIDLQHGRIISELISEGYQLVAISVSGRTKSLVEAAKLWARNGGKVISITADTSSPLAKNSTMIVKLTYSSLAEGVGAARQLAVLTALSRLVDGYTPRLVKNLVEELALDLEKLAITGSLESFGVAYFMALKLYETLCMQSIHVPLEQLMHAPVFGLKPKSTVIVFAPSRSSERFTELINVLKRLGFNVKVVPGLNNPWDTVVSQTYWVLRILISVLEAKNVVKPCYMLTGIVNDISKAIYY